MDLDVDRTCSAVRTCTTVLPPVTTKIAFWLFQACIRSAKTRLTSNDTRFPRFAIPPSVNLRLCTCGPSQRREMCDAEGLNISLEEKSVINIVIVHSKLKFDNRLRDQGYPSSASKNEKLYLSFLNLHIGNRTFKSRHRSQSFKRYGSSRVAAFRPPRETTA